MKALTVLTAVSVIFAGTLVFAAKKGTANAPVIDMGEFATESYGMATFDRLVVETKKLEKVRNDRLKRAPANGSGMSAEYTQLVGCMKVLKTRQDVLALLKAVEASLAGPSPLKPNGCSWTVSGQINQLPVDYVFVAAQIVPALEFEAIVTRVRDYAQKAKLPDVFLITAMRRMVALARVWEQGAGQENAYFKALREYFIFPQTKSKREDNISNDADMVVFLDKVGQRLKVTYSQIKPLLQRLNAQSPYFELDSSVIWGGTVDFTEQFRYVSFGAPEVYATLSSINGVLYGISLGRAYQTRGLGNALNNMATRMGVLANVAEGFTAVDQRRVLNDERDLFTLDTRVAPCSVKNPLSVDMTEENPSNKLATPEKVPVGVCSLYSAYYQLRTGIENANLARTALETAPTFNAQNAPLFDPTVLAPGTRGFQMAEKTLVNLRSMVTGCLTAGTTRATPVPGVVSEGTHVNVCDFFMGSTTQIKGRDAHGHIVDFEFQGRYYANDLRSFLPTEPRNDSLNVLTDLPGDYNGFKVRNWDFEQGTAWNYPLFQRYYPNVKDAASLRSTTRSLVTAWGGGLVAVPLLTIF